jgi:hypothetical protein
VSSYEGYRSLLPAGACGLAAFSLRVFFDSFLYGKLKNKDLAAKKAKLKADHVPMDPILDAANAWTDGEIKSRSEALAKVAYEKISSFQAHGGVWRCLKRLRFRPQLT